MELLVRSTATMTPEKQDIKMMACSVDFDDAVESEFRFLVDQKHIKIVTTKAGALAGLDIEPSFGPDIVRVMPCFPPGSWNQGTVAKDPATGRLVFSSTSRVDFPGVKDIWHPVTVDHLELTELDRFQQNTLKVSHHLFSRPVVCKLTAFPWQIPYMEAETRAYRWIQGKGIGPEFLDHVTEEGRVIGFVMEYVEGATATREDADVCRAALTKLHSLGIKHGDVKKGNFVITGDKATMIDFEMARKCDHEHEFHEDWERFYSSFGRQQVKRLGT